MSAPFQQPSTPATPPDPETVAAEAIDRAVAEGMARGRRRRARVLCAQPRAVPTPRDRDVLLRPAAACTRCGARPAMRLTRELADLVGAYVPPDVRVATYQCQRRGCGAVYEIHASAFLGAA